LIIGKTDTAGVAKWLRACGLCARHTVRVRNVPSLALIASSSRSAAAELSHRIRPRRSVRFSKSLDGAGGLALGFRLRLSELPCFSATAARTLRSRVWLGPDSAEGGQLLELFPFFFYFFFFFFFVFFFFWRISSAKGGGGIDASREMVLDQWGSGPGARVRQQRSGGLAAADSGGQAWRWSRDGKRTPSCLPRTRVALARPSCGGLQHLPCSRRQRCVVDPEPHRGARPAPLRLGDA